MPVSLSRAPKMTGGRGGGRGEEAKKPISVPLGRQAGSRRRLWHTMAYYGIPLRVGKGKDYHTED
jgi:hypothetical protein